MGTLQVGGTTLGTKNISTNKIELENSFLKESGSIVQVQSTQLTTSASTTSISANTNIVVSNGTASGTGSGILDVDITPKITGSKIWLQCNWTGEFSNAANVYNHMFFFWRNTTKLANTEPSPGARHIGISPATLTYEGSADAASTPEHLFMQYFDTHGISAGTQITYKLGLTCVNGGALYTNRNVTDADSSSYERGVSSLVAIELAP
jgi:hypothetical protein